MQIELTIDQAKQIADTLKAAVTPEIQDKRNEAKRQLERAARFIADALRDIDEGRNLSSCVFSNTTSVLADASDAAAKAAALTELFNGSFASYQLVKAAASLHA